jgi:hypothetical protein
MDGAYLTRPRSFDDAVVTGSMKLALNPNKQNTGISYIRGR